jgi:hypothetical protein
MADINKYEPISKNWYKQLPYTFAFTNKNNQTTWFNLPISPSNINITTHFATNVIATMYGTVEEHSEQRYFDITISGTTGMGPKYYREKSDPLGESDKLADSDKKGAKRLGFEPQSKLFGNLGGFARRSRDLLNKTLESASGVAGILKPDDAVISGIADDANGYVAFHNFYLFLLKYKKDVASPNISRQGHPLQFINYKDNNQYDVSITNFQLTRDQRSPMLYNYNITMRAYNLRNADRVLKAAGLSLSDVGLGGVETSAFAKLSNGARKARNAAYALIAAAKGLGK